MVIIITVKMHIIMVINDDEEEAEDSYVSYVGNVGNVLTLHDRTNSIACWNIPRWCSGEYRKATQVQYLEWVNKNAVEQIK